MHVKIVRPKYRVSERKARKIGEKQTLWSEQNGGRCSVMKPHARLQALLEQNENQSQPKILHKNHCSADRWLCCVMDDGRCLLIPKYFCAVSDCAGKADLLLESGKKIGGNHAFFRDNFKQQLF